MSETILATIVGGIIASIVPVIVQLIEYKKWKKTLKVDFLKDKRSRLESVYNKVKSELLDAMLSGKYPHDLVDKINTAFPVSVLEKVSEFTSKKKHSVHETHMWYMEICEAMQKSIDIIDLEIESTIK